MPHHNTDKCRFALAIAVSVAMHALVLAWTMTHSFKLKEEAKTPPPKERLVFVAVMPLPPKNALPESTLPTTQAIPPEHAAAQAPKAKKRKDKAPTTLVAKRPLATQDAPPAPTAEEWAFAAQYRLKNSKGYRYNWGQQVRSMMGTAVEGPEQGAVRFRIEIASDGTLARLDTLWSTSATVEKRARNAVEQMPRLPPTPTGKPLIFEKTITFNPWTSDAPPLYKHDCEPDPVQHGNRFVWDGRSPQVVAEQAVAEKLDPAAYVECLRQLPQDSIEAEAASDERQQMQWASPTLGK